MKKFIYLCKKLWDFLRDFFVEYKERKVSKPNYKELYGAVMIEREEWVKRNRVKRNIDERK